jgi:hypothetical protein
MRIRKTLMVLAAVALPLASVALLEGTAVAKGVVGSGTVTCHLGGTVTFTPPLSYNGSPASKEVVSVSATLSSCSGGTPAGTAGGTVAIKPIKIKGTAICERKLH